MKAGICTQPSHKMYYKYLLNFAKSHYTHVEISHWPVIENKYVFIGNSMLIALEKMAVKEGKNLSVDYIDTKNHERIPVFHLSAPFQIDPDFFLGWDYLFSAASTSK